MAALAGTGLYLLHPLQSEAVAYISSRSEVLCALFAYAALLVFLAASPAGDISWTRSLAVTTLLALSALSKEPGVAMAGVFVALDLFSESPLTLKPLLRRWRLYVPMLAAASFVGFRLYALLSREGTAGATAKHKPIDYLLTQFTVFWHYVRLIVFPVGQNLDHDYPAVRAPGTIFTWAGFVAIAAVLVLLWKWRARYPLAFLGAVFLLILLAPTSSVVPIDDAMAERRLYLGFPGVAMIAAEFLRRIRPSPRAAAAIAAVLAVLGGLTWRRAELYTSAVAMWQDSVSVNPRNSRAWFHLAFAFYEQGRCAEASRAYEKAAMAGGADYTLLVDWALALQCAGRLDEALAKLEEAKKLQRHSHAWAVEGRILAQKGDLGGALESLNEAIRMNPYDSNAMVYRGNVHMLRNDPAAALADYELALRLAPGDPAAAKGRQAALAALARSR
jgi:Flp pilus assembly protein TadD